MVAAACWLWSADEDEVDASVGSVFDARRLSPSSDDLLVVLLLLAAVSLLALVLRLSADSLPDT